MMNKIFNRSNNEMVEIMEELVERVENQNKIVVSTGTKVVDLFGVVEGLRQQFESMEVRLAKRNEQMVELALEEFGKGIDTVMQVVKSELQSLEKNTKPTEIVKAIEKRTVEEKKIRQLKIVKSRLDKAVSEHLMHDLPLSKEVKGYKTIELTPQGSKIYDAISSFIVATAKVAGRNKEYYTSRKMYDDFFRKFGITPYKRVAVRKSDGKQQTTLLSAIIVKGHIRQYVDYIKKLHDEEVSRFRQVIN